jgi:hypothetical protein
MGEVRMSTKTAQVEPIMAPEEIKCVVNDLNNLLETTSNFVQIHPINTLIKLRVALRFKLVAVEGNRVDSILVQNEIDVLDAIIDLAKAINKGVKTSCGGDDE